MVELGTFIVLVLLGFVFGKITEKRHFDSLKKREAQFLSKPGTSCKFVPDQDISFSTLATGSVVISIDSFKKLMASLVGLFGGEMTSYSSLIERARREAVLRMKESVPSADAYLNVKIETSSISQSHEGIGSIEVLCYATAVKFKNSSN